MATRKVKLKGLAYWAKVFPQNRDLTGYDNTLVDVGGQTTIDVDLTDMEIAKLNKSGSMLRGTPSKDNEGLTRVKFKRKWEETYGGGAPEVIKPDGTPWDYDMDGIIGNGSTVEVILSVYDTSRKNIVGTRLEKVNVTNLVKYEAPEFEPEEEPIKVQPKSVKKQPVQELEEDEVPF